MAGLATIALDYLTLILFGSEDEIDPDYSFKMTGMVPQYLTDLNDSERAALSEAAKEQIVRSEELFRGAENDSDYFAFLETVASGEVFGQFGP